MGWPESQCTYVWIFSIGRGNAAFLRSGLNQGFILDMGGGNLFDPAKFIKQRFAPKLDPYNKRAIAQVVLSHPHSDHIFQCGELVDGQELHPRLLTCPHDKDYKDGNPSYEKVDWKRIENADGSNKEILTAYRSLFADRNLPLQTICYESRRSIPNLEYGVYYVRPPICDDLHEEDTKYCNATSIVFYYRHGDHTILFPGDITPEAMRIILNEDQGLEKRYTIFDSSFSSHHPKWHEMTNSQPSLRSLLRDRGLSILVAPHHGLESCYSQEVFDEIRGGKPQLVAISERRHKDKSPGKIHPRYQSDDGASGLTVQIEGKPEFRRSATTLNGHHILIVFAGTGRPRVYLDKDPNKLLALLDN